MQKIILDLQQEKIWQKLQKNAKILQKTAKKSFFSQIFDKNDEKALNFYIYSAPGRGKTMLMRRFFDEIDDFSKKYFHFNEFMQKIHENLHEIRKNQENIDDELIFALKKVISGAKLVCFDEFQVHDIADAMLLGRIFSYFFASDIAVVVTSNTPPEKLYLNGLQRELFLEFVNNILLKNVEVIKIDDNIDYRLQYEKSLNERYFVDSKQNRAHLDEIIANLSDEGYFTAREIEVWGRKIVLNKAFKEVAVIDFADLCEKDLAAADYRAICAEFGLIFLLNLPILDEEMPNETRRFMLFIDEVYENRVALIILAQSGLDNIYSSEKLRKVNARVLSRLSEINSDHYYNNSKIFD